MVTKTEWVELQHHVDFCITLNMFLNIDRPFLITSDQQTSLDRPGPSSVHVIGEEEEKTGNTAAFCSILSHGCFSGIVIAGFDNNFKGCK
jgi:hypothetical protein